MHVVAVSLSPVHGFSKQPVPEIQVVAGWGIQGDCHAGTATQHLYRKRKTPGAPNRTQVHLLQAELLDSLTAQGFTVAPGTLGENILIRGADLLNLPVGAQVHLGASAVIEITGLRDPCAKLNAVQDGLMKACFGRAPDGTSQRLAGVMGIALSSGSVRPGDPVRITLPPEPWTDMGPV